ncbi:efflux RND transporter periplasmic adaptor subunit [Chitinispirillales bacterium ANBcel5]|uniref:efflux RND transporter periplasmic adaptor subunit n=1 Tax=Cellulosispirillum alkaliphilum TaxID=3039283 RepID=UPI002A52B976|nr:efflux RND transporter periplasmic adaptor subunit [Chitinispirillales bacterium ANBcel5]
MRANSKNIKEKIVSTFSSAKDNKKLRTILIVLLAFVVAYRLGGAFSPGASDHFSHDHDHDHTHEQDENGYWTCSMHPQIVLSEPGQCPICHMDLIPMESGSGSQDEHGERALTLSQSAARLSRVVTTPVNRQSGAVNVNMNGRIVPDENRIEVISARMGGRIDRLLVGETGARVNRGTPLAAIYSPELLALQQELISANASVKRIGQSASELVRNSAQRNLNAAREKLRLLGFSNSQLEEIMAQSTPSDHMTIRSAQAGIVLERKVSGGDYVQEGTDLFKIADISGVWAKLDAYERDLSHLRVGQEVEFTVSALPGETFTGNISFIDPVIDPFTRTAGVRVEVNNSDYRLKPEMYLRASTKPKQSDTDLDSDSKPLVIPSTAPLFTGKRAVVYVEKSSDDQGYVYEGRDVVLGPRTGDYYIVESGLEEGERVVSHGAFRIDSELQIRGRPSMMNPEGGALTGAHAHHGDHQEAGTPEDSHEGIDETVHSVEVSSAFLENLDPVYQSYFNLSKSLANDDHNSAVVAMGELGEQIDKVHGSSGDDLTVWDESKKEMLEVISHKNHYSDIEELRNAFANLSEQVITLQRVYGHHSGEHFLAFCPMALNDKGAYWLQSQDQISNPYFGESMLRCGEIKETF